MKKMADLPGNYILYMKDGDRCEVNQPRLPKEKIEKIIPLLAISGKKLRTQQWLVHIESFECSTAILCSQCSSVIFPSVKGLGHNIEFVKCNICEAYLDPSRDCDANSPLPDFAQLSKGKPWKAGYTKISENGSVSTSALKIINEIHKIFNDGGQRVPNILYHYSSSSTFKNILDNQTIWLTPIQEMNDLSEGKYGIELLDKYIKDNAVSQIQQSIEAQKSKQLDDSKYAFCLCEEKDVLGQWREYSEGGAGFAIGFDTKKLTEKKYRIVRIIYDVGKQKEILSKVFGLTKTFVKPNTPTVDKSAIVNAISSEASVLFKHPAFQDEREWRIVTTINGGNGNIKYRVGKFGVTPYLEAGRKQSKEWDIFPIVHVVCGPSPNSIRGQNNLIRYLESIGLGHVQVDTSTIPLR